MDSNEAQKEPQPTFGSVHHRFASQLQVSFLFSNEIIKNQKPYMKNWTEKVALRMKLWKKSSRESSTLLTWCMYRTIESDMYTRNSKWEPGNIVRLRQNNSQGHSANRNTHTHTNTVHTLTHRVTKISGRERRRRKTRTQS